MKLEVQGAMVWNIRQNPVCGAFRRSVALWAAVVGIGFLGGGVPAYAADAPPQAAKLRIFTCANSFHWWLPMWLTQVESCTEIKDHTQLGISKIGGAQIIRHWDIPDVTNQAKAALMTGQVDVLTLGAMLAPDAGIDKFVQLGLAHNPKMRVTLQEFWLPFDSLTGFNETSYGAEAVRLRNWQDPPPTNNSLQTHIYDTTHFNVPTAEQIEKLHALYFERWNAFIADENQKYGRQVIFAVPVGQAVVALRRKIIEGKVPGITRQSDLFGDNLGHPQAHIWALSAYCHFAVIYHRSPVGLPVPFGLAKQPHAQELNLLLQQLAWDAVTHHPLSGCADLKDK